MIFKLEITDKKEKLKLRVTNPIISEKDAYIR